MWMVGIGYSTRLTTAKPKNMILLEAISHVQHIDPRQGPRNVDLRTPPGPEGSNGSLLDICRGHPGTFFQCKIKNAIIGLIPFPFLILNF